MHLMSSHLYIYIKFVSKRHLSFSNTIFKTLLFSFLNFLENQYCIQFKRVKARRTSSSSQNDCNKIIKNRTFNKEHSIHDNNLQSKLYTSNRINDKLIQSNLYCTLNDLPHDQEPVKKHLESWLKETVTRTIQGKAL